MEENRKKKIIVTIIGILVLVVALVGATYAWFSSTSKVESKITTAKTELIVDVDEELTHITNIKPTTWNESIETNNDNTDIAQIPITVTSKSTVNINYDLTISSENLKLNEDETLEGGSLSDIKYRLYKVTESKTEEVADGTFITPKKEQIMLWQKEISPSEIQNYMLYIYISNTNELQNKLQGLNFNIIINGKAKAPGYQELEYIESTGTQYIDTGIVATNDTGINIKYRITAAGSARVFGILTHYPVRTDAFLIDSYNGNTDTNLFIAHRGFTKSLVKIDFVSDYSFKINYLNDNSIYFNDEFIGNTGTSDVYKASIPMFARFYANNGDITSSNSRIYYVEFTEGNDITHKFIPAKNKKGVVGMYDIITNKFYTNSGTGDFIAGPVKE